MIWGILFSSIKQTEINIKHFVGGPFDENNNIDTMQATILPANSTGNMPCAEQRD